MEGSSLAHEQIFILLKACQELAGIASGGAQEPLMENSVDKNRSHGGAASAVMPDINWVSDPGRNAYVPAEPGAGEPSEQTDFAPENEATAQEPETKTHTMASDFTSPAPRSGTILDSNENKIADERETPLSETNQTVKFAGPDFYGMLDVEEEASGERIHLQFLLRVRATLRFIKDREEPLRGQERQKVLKNLQTIWIAHDVLLDPATRADYDFRRTGEDATAGEGDLPGAGEKNIRIGELLQTSGLLEKTELEIAADMHKAMPELMFGAFLVKQGFVQEDDLECVLIAQQLIKGGDISMAQFLEIMEERGGTSLSFTALLLAKQMITSSRLREVIANLPSEEAGIIGLGAEDAEKREHAESDRDAAEGEVENASRLDLAKAAPSWKDQLDWSMADEEEDSDKADTETGTETDAGTVKVEGKRESGDESEDQKQDGDQDELKVQDLVQDRVQDLVQDRIQDQVRDQVRDEDRTEPAVELEPGLNLDSKLETEPVTEQGFLSEQELEIQPIEDEEKSTGQKDHRVKKRSLIDLIVDLKSPEALTARDEDSVSEDLFSSIEEKRSKEVEEAKAADIPSLDEALFGNEEQDGALSSQFEKELSDFDLGPEPAADSPMVPEVDLKDLDLPLPESVEDLEALEALPDDFEDDAEADSSQTDTSSEVPALKPEDVKAHLDKESWSIVSMPASYLASFLMDEDSSQTKQKKEEQSNDDKNKDKDPRNRFKRNKRNK